MVDPGLVALAVEALDQEAEVLRRAADAVDEEDRDPPRIVGLEEVDAGPDLADRGQRRPHPGLGLLGGEPRVVEGRNLAAGDRDRVDRREVEAGEIDPEIGRKSRLFGKPDLLVLELLLGLDDDPLGPAVDAHRLSRIRAPVAVQVLEGDEEVGAPRLEDEDVVPDHRGQPIDVRQHRPLFGLLEQGDVDVLGAAPRGRRRPGHQAEATGLRQLPVEADHRTAGERQQQDRAAQRSGSTARDARKRAHMSSDSDPAV